MQQCNNTIIKLQNQTGQLIHISNFESSKLINNNFIQETQKWIEIVRRLHRTLITTFHWRPWMVSSVTFPISQATTITVFQWQPILTIINGINPRNTSSKNNNQDWSWRRTNKYNLSILKIMVWSSKHGICQWVFINSLFNKNYYRKNDFI